MKSSLALRNFLLGSSLLAAVTTAHAQDGTYNSQTGAWNLDGSWSGGTAADIADGINSTAFFTNDVLAASTTTLGADRTIGNITFTDADNTTGNGFNRVINGNTLTLDVTDGGSPLINVTQSSRELNISSILAGADGLTKTGAGILRLNNANNTFTGKIVVSQGQLRITTTTNALGGNPVAFTADHITLSGGGNLFSTGTLANSLGNRGITLGAGGGGIGANNSATFTADVAITGSGALTNASGTTGTVILTGNNTYTGGTNANTATTQLGHANALGSNTAQLSVNANLVMNDFNATVGNLIGTSGGRIRNNGSVTSTLTIGNGDNGGGTFAGVIENGTTGTVALTKTGSAKITLSGANTYTGATIVDGGVLAVNGSLANTSTTVGTGSPNSGTLQGSGSIGGSVTIQSGGTLASGNSIESLATGTLNLNAGSTFAYEINNDALADVAGDLTAVTGDLNITGGLGGAILTIGDLGAGGWSLTEKLTLISYTGNWNNGLLTYLGSEVIEGGSITTTGGYTWSLNYNDTLEGTNYATESPDGESYVTMTVTAIPEPRAALLGGLGMLILLRRRRG